MVLDDFGGMQTAADVAAEAGVELYGGVLCSDQGQRAAYYNKLIEPIVYRWKPKKERLNYSISVVMQSAKLIQ